MIDFDQRRRPAFRTHESEIGASNDRTYAWVPVGCRGVVNFISDFSLDCKDRVESPLLLSSDRCAENLQLAPHQSTAERGQLGVDRGRWLGHGAGVVLVELVSRQARAGRRKASAGPEGSACLGRGVHWACSPRSRSTRTSNVDLCWRLQNARAGAHVVYDIGPTDILAYLRYPRRGCRQVARGCGYA